MKHLLVKPLSRAICLQLKSAGFPQKGIRLKWWTDQRYLVMGGPTPDEVLYFVSEWGQDLSGVDPIACPNSDELFAVLGRSIARLEIGDYYQGVPAAQLESTFSQSQWSTWRFTPAEALAIFYLSTHSVEKKS